MTQKSRLGLASLLAVAVLSLAGCGGSPAKPAASAPESPTNPAASAPGAPAPAPAAAQNQEPEFRVVQHAMGETKVPANPQRVVVLDMGELDMAIALGIKPVGAALYTMDQPFPAHLKEYTDGIQRVGTVGQPNLEAIAALKPDLILSNKPRHEKIYDQLPQIAPTVLAPGLGVDWKEAFQVHAAALGKAAEAEAIMQEYYNRLAAFKEQMGDRLAQTKVSIVRSFPDHVRIYMKKSFIGTIIEDAGLPRPAAQDKDIFMEKATAERIPDLDGDVIFLLYYNKAQGESLSPLMQNPLWQQLSAVKNGRVYEANDEIWGLGLGPMAAKLVVDDLFEFLVK